MVSVIEAYIRQAAQARGIDPDVAVRVARSEGGLSDPFRQGDAMLSYGREQSYGPFQLHIRGGGVGERAIKAGIDPRKNWQGGVDYALNEAAQKGWGQWFGAAKAGIGNRTGLGGARAAGTTADLSPAALDFVKNNPQPGGFGLGVPDPNTPGTGWDTGSMPGGVFGSMSPGRSPMMGPPAGAADFAFSKDSKIGDRLSAAGAAFDQAANEYPAPKISGGGGDARQTGSALLKLLQNPNALAQALMSRRM